MALKNYDEFRDKGQAEGCAATMRAFGVQFVRIRKVSHGPFKYAVYLGGKNSQMYV